MLITVFAVVDWLENKLMKRTLDLDHVMRWLDYFGYILRLCSFVDIIRRMIRYIPTIRREFIMIVTTLSMFGLRKELDIHSRKGVMFQLLHIINRFITQFLLIVTDRHLRKYLFWNEYVASNMKPLPVYFVVYTNAICYRLFNTFCPKMLRPALHHRRKERAAFVDIFQPTDGPRMLLLGRIVSKHLKQFFFVLEPLIVDRF